MPNPHGYLFYFDDGSEILTFPVTPSELSIKVGSKNKVVTLISEGDINILKSPSLIEIEFEARFPMRKYPYSRKVSGFKTYFDKLKELKEDKKPFNFIVERTTPNGKRTWDTELKVALEEFELKENADEGDDVLVEITLKQYKDYGVKILANNLTTSTSSNNNRGTNNKGDTSSNYTVKSGDCLWNIAKAAYGDGSKWRIIYEANKSVIESTAKKYGRSSSSDGHWIYPNTKLVIPSVNDAANLNVQKLGSGSSGSSGSSNESVKSTQMNVILTELMAQKRTNGSGSSNSSSSSNNSNTSSSSNKSSTTGTDISKIMDASKLKGNSGQNVMGKVFYD